MKSKRATRKRRELSGFQSAVKHLKPEGEMTEFCPHQHATMNEAWDCTFFHFLNLEQVWLAEKGHITDGPMDRNPMTDENGIVPLGLRED